MCWEPSRRGPNKLCGLTSRGHERGDVTSPSGVRPTHERCCGERFANRLLQGGQCVPVPCPPAGSVYPALHAAIGRSTDRLGQDPGWPAQA